VKGVHPAVVGEAIGDGTHGVFAHTEVNVAPQPGLAVEITLAVSVVSVEHEEVSIAPQEPRHLAGDGGQDLAARTGAWLAHPWAKKWAGSKSQPEGNSPCQGHVPLARQVRVLRGPSVEPFLPRASARAPRSTAVRKWPMPLRKKELLVRIQPRFFLVSFTSSAPKGEPWASLLLPCGRAVADSGVNHDEGRPLRLGLACDEGAVNRLKVGVTVVNPQDLPAVGFEALAHVLGKGQRGRAVERDPVVVVEPTSLPSRR